MGSSMIAHPIETQSSGSAEDPALTDELPYAPGLLADTPAELRTRIYAAFQVHSLYGVVRECQKLGGACDA
jgi:hypothetical protein